MTLTKDNFDEVIAKHELVVVDFWADWCQPCKSFAKTFEEVAKQNPEFIFGKVNTEEQPELAADFNVRSIPMVMILRDKVMVYCESGALPANVLNELLKQTKALDMVEVRKHLGEGQ